MKFKVASVRFLLLFVFFLPRTLPGAVATHSPAAAATATPDRSGFTTQLRQTLLIDSFTLASAWFDIARRKE